MHASRAAIHVMNGILLVITVLATSQSGVKTFVADQMLPVGAVAVTESGCGYRFTNALLPLILLSKRQLSLKYVGVKCC